MKLQTWRLRQVAKVLGENYSASLGATLAYLISHGFLLACWNALFWDDWVPYSRDSPFVRSFFGESQFNSVPFRGTYESWFIAIGPWSMRLAIFLIWPATAFCLSKLLRELHVLPERTSRTITLMFLLIPAYGARVALINFTSQFSVFLFVLGSWLVLRTSLIHQCIGVIALSVSLFFPSLQVFISVTFALAVWLRWRSGMRWGSLFHPTLLIIIVLPWFHRYAVPWLAPSLRTDETGYNAVSVLYLLRALSTTTILFVPLVLTLRRASQTRSPDLGVWLVAVGSALVGVGSFPYMAVGHFMTLTDWILPFLPDASDWYSRHQILQTFGLSILLTGIAHCFGKYQRTFSVLVIVLSIALNVSIYSRYYLDSLKQQAFIEAVATEAPEIRDGDAIVIVDDAWKLNARRRAVRPNEWRGLMYRATGHEVLIDAESLNFCLEENPRYKYSIFAGSRWRALLQNKVDLWLIIEEIPICRDLK